MPERKPNHDKQHKQRGLPQELAELDARILELLGRRARLMAKVASARKAKGLSAADPAVEKKLWPQWAEAGRREGLEPKTLHNAFTVLNAMAYERGLGRTGTSRADPFVLAPGPKALDLDIQGPGSLLEARIHAATAAASGQPLSLGRVVQNDPLVELIKALNQAGGRLAWGESSMQAQEGPELDASGKLLFAGSNPGNLSLLMAMTLARMGVTKFSGAAALKLADLGPAEQLFPRLGGRLQRLDHHAPGLPARLEAGGRMASSLAGVDDAPDHLLLALLSLGWSYPDGLRLELSPERITPGLQLAMETAVHALSLWGLEASFAEGVASAKPGRPAAFPARDLSLDPVLAAYALALPLAAVGRVRVRGSWPDIPAARAILDELGSLGLDLRQTADSVEASASARPERPAIRFGANPDLLPLAVALGLAANKGAEISPLPDDVHAASAVALLAHCQADYDIEDRRIIIRPSNIRWEAPLEATDPLQCLGCSLIAFLRPGIGLLNPGEITSLWPGWWSLFNRACGARQAPKPQKENHDDTRRRRRRIITS